MNPYLSFDGFFVGLCKNIHINRYIHTIHSYRHTDTDTHTRACTQNLYRYELENSQFNSIIQSNHAITGILYSGHLVIADRFSRNRWNPGQTLIANLLYSGHFYSRHSL